MSRNSKTVGNRHRKSHKPNERETTNRLISKSNYERLVELMGLIILLVLKLTFEHLIILMS